MMDGDRGVEHPQRVADVRLPGAINVFVRIAAPRNVLTSLRVRRYARA